MPNQKPAHALLHGGATLLPRPMLSRLGQRLLQSLERRHPRLFENLAALDPARLLVTPTDLPFSILLELGRRPVGLRIVGADGPGSDAQVSGSLDTLIDLLEGRIDSDTLFFRRDLQISGSTAVVVGLRNVLDREILVLNDEIAAMFGALAPAARSVARRCEGLLDGLGARMAALHRRLHPADGPADSAGAEITRCQEEIAALTARLARLEARQQRAAERRP